MPCVQVTGSSMSSRSSDIVKLDSVSGTTSPSDVEVLSNSDRYVNGLI